MEETVHQLRDRTARGSYDVDAAVAGAGLGQGHVVFSSSNGQQHPEAGRWGWRMHPGQGAVQQVL